MMWRLGTVMTVAERRMDFKLTTDTPYIAPTGELWGVYCKDIGENWPRYNGTALYLIDVWLLHCVPSPQLQMEPSAQFI